MKKCKSLGLIFGLATSLILSACSNPVGDFGRINKLRATHITEVGPVSIEAERTHAYFNPLDYSTLEKELRLTAVLLVRSNYDINIADRQFDGEKADIMGPIREHALVRSFRDIGLNDTKDRYQSLAADLKKRRLDLDSFIGLASKVLKQDKARARIDNEIINVKIIKALGYRQKQNIEVMEGVKKQMEALYLAYRYVLNHGKLVDPSVSQFSIRSELELFNSEIKQLETK